MLFMQMQPLDFTKIVKKIEAHKILLPDFQRDFVWKDENMQKQIVASVFAQMPIGSILLLKSKPDEFCSKNIGSNDEVDNSLLDEEVEFLLDGQQRLTVLTNVFSDVIFEQCKNWKNLKSPNLKRRFFLSIPKWETYYNNEGMTDVLGVRRLQNPCDSFGNVSFLTSDVLSHIEVRSFLSGDNKVFNPQSTLNHSLDSFCTNTGENYLIPLYVFIPTENNQNSAPVRKKKIIEGIGKKIVDEIIDKFITLSDPSEKSKLLNSLLPSNVVQSIESKILVDFDSAIEDLEDSLGDLSDVWTENLRKYIDSCLTKMAISEIEVSSEQRARAIDIYENLNRGGISLSTFDLVMARVAIVSKVNFRERITDNILKSRTYDANLMPSSAGNLFKKKYASGGYIAAQNTKCITDSGVDKTYIDAFLNVMSLYCNNKLYNPQEYNLDHIKRNRILQLDPSEIDGNCEKICTALDRALFFFQSRCGIRYIKELNNSLMLVLVATVFTNDDYFNDRKIHEKLEAWYWASIFSGEFDKDQNSVLIKDLKQFIGMIQGLRNDTWIREMSNSVLNSNNYSDKELLLLEKVSQERYPKKLLRNYISQYFLAKTYTDMFDKNLMISVFSDVADTLELHHIVPLGSVNKVFESTNTLRQKKDNICNSPLNFVFITKASNLAISNKSLNDYAQIITITAKSTLLISDYVDSNSVSDDQKVKAILTNRYNNLRGLIQNRILKLLV